MNETSIAVFRTFTADRTLSIGDVNVLIDGEAVDARDEALDEGFDDDKTCNRNFMTTLIFSWKRVIEQCNDVTFLSATFPTQSDLHNTFFFTILGLSRIEWFPMFYQRISVIFQWYFFGCQLLTQ